MKWTRIRLLVAVVVGVLLVGAVAGGLYFELGQGPEPEALAAVEDDPDVAVERTGAGYLVRSGPVTGSTTGIVLYPGARVEPASYVPTAADIVRERDVVVVVPEVPLNLAILGVDRAAKADAAVPQVDRWYVGGHSLGGVAACRYAAGDPGRVEGVVLFASYCDRDLSGTDLRALSVLGTADRVLDREAERENRESLPAGARVVEIEGMNHAQFGAYGTQRGDGEPAIPDREARRRVAEAVVNWLEAGAGRLEYVRGDRKGPRWRRGTQGFSPVSIANSLRGSPVQVNT